ncbi:MAG TPA: hypothetical protein VJJ21_01125 [Candidatus Nanoarchaeia archaeon]|nr:hypothetical protein [Candidatus Nanoarchaeia archaeon]
MNLIVSDTDFLSSFAKIGELNLLFKVLKTNEIVIPDAVYNELKKSIVFDSLLPFFSDKDRKIIVKKIVACNFPDYLGAGEKEAITLAQKMNIRLLMNDKVAGLYAEKLGVNVVDIPSFLFYCKEKKFLDISQLKNLIAKLKAKDFYELEREIEIGLISEK